MSTASDERIVDPQEELEPEARDRVEVLEKEEREEEHAEADYEQDQAPEAASHYQQVLALVGAVFRDELVELDEIEGISDDERAAFAALEEVVRGKDLQEERILYAEKRLEMLNHVLAVLQPTLAMGLTPELAGLRGEFDALVADVAALREHLEELDSAQEEIFEQDRHRGEEAPDTDDKPDDEPDDEPTDPDAPRPSTLYGKPGEPAVDRPPTKSTLGDD